MFPAHSRLFDHFFSFFQTFLLYNIIITNHAKPDSWMAEHYGSDFRALKAAIREV